MLVSVRYFNWLMREAFEGGGIRWGDQRPGGGQPAGDPVVKSFANEPMEVHKFQEGNQRFVNIKASATATWPVTPGAGL